MAELIFRDDAYARSCEATVTAVDARGIRLDRTAFYATGGGQPGDVGVLRRADGSIVAIADAVKGEAPDEVIHVPAPGAALPEVFAGSTQVQAGSGSRDQLRHPAAIGPLETRSAPWR